MNNLTSRILVALFGIPALVAVILQGGVLFCGVIVLISSVGLWEFYSMAEKKGVSPNMYLGIGLGAAMQIFFFTNSFDANFGILMSNTAAFGVLITLTVATLLGEMFRGKPNPLLNTAVTIGGVVYVSVFLQCLIGIRGFHTILGVENMQGGYFILCMFISIWLCDTAAYFVGRAIGRHKLFERVSPKKTWEGAIAGLIAAIAGFIGISAWLLPTLPVVHAVVLGAIVGTLGQAGDLAESLLKRDAGIKDSSAILAGHGGVLDRFDSILMVSPLAYWYILIVALLGK